MIDNSRVRRCVLATFAAACAVVSVAACGSSGGSHATAGTATAGTAATTGTGASALPAATTQATAQATTQSTAPAAGTDSAATDPAGAEPNALAVTAFDSASSMSYEISGTPHPGLVTITFTNKGKYAHEMGVSMLRPGVTLGRLEAALKGKGGEQAAQKLIAEPDADYPVPSIVGPGASETDVATLAAGHYVVACFLPGPDGMPHVMMGMIGEFTVGGDPSAAAPPQTSGTVELTDTGITIPAGFGTGGTVEVTNTGSKVHDFSVAKLAGKPLPALFQCVGESFAKGTMIDKCPGTLLGGLQGLRPGQHAYLTITLPAGSYGYVSTQGDGADMQAGLAGTFTVG